MLWELIGGWTFDFKTAIVTLLLAPVAFHLMGILKTALTHWASYLLEGILYWVQRAANRSLAGTLTLKRYARLRLAGDTRYLLVPSRLNFTLDIDDMFVKLELVQTGGRTGIFDHRNVLTVGNRIHVMGDPGSGKSTLVKRLFRDACVEAIRRPSRSRLPILLELKQLVVPKGGTAQSEEWLFEELRRLVSAEGVYKMSECFDVCAKSHGLLVCLDGLDEVSTQQYPVVFRAIVRLSEVLTRHSAENVIVLTMRTQFYEQIQNDFRELGSQALLLRSFAPSDIFEFLRRWPFASDREKHIARIYGELTDRPTLREMCSNPLVLAMYVGNAQSDGHVAAPESRTEFYRVVTEELIMRRRLRQLGSTSAHTAMREQREQILGRLAFHHMLDEGQAINSLLWKDAIATTMEVVKCPEAEAEALFREIARETGLVTEERLGERFRFIHLTFCEFLAAQEATDGQPTGWKDLLAHHEKFTLHGSRVHMRTRLLEVIPFACGLMARVQRPSAITDVAALGDNALLARCFLETKQYDHDVWPVFVARQRASLIGARTDDGRDDWLRKLHLFNVVVKDANEASVHLPVAGPGVDLDELFHTLVDTERKNLAALFAAYAKEDAVAALRLAELSRLDMAIEMPEIVLASCDQSPFLALAAEKAVTPEVDSRDRWATLIAESALRATLVGWSLAAMKPNEAAHKLLAQSPAAKHWFRSGSLDESAYTQLLTLALRSESAADSTTKYTDVVRPIVAPGSAWWIVSGGPAPVATLIALAARG